MFRSGFALHYLVSAVSAACVLLAVSSPALADGDIRGENFNNTTASDESNGTHTTDVSPPSHDKAFQSMPTDECDISNSSLASTPCPVGGGVGSDSPNTNIVAARSIANSQALTAIDAQGKCRYIDNAANNSPFIPFRTQAEWLSFLNTNLSGITQVHCSRSFPTPSFSVPVPPYSGSGCTATPSVSTPQIYGRYISSTNYAVWPSTPLNASFTTCHNGKTTINAQVSWYGLDADIVTPSWELGVTYGPDFTLTASASTLSGNVTGSQINVLAGTLVTLTWGSSSIDSNVVGTVGTPATMASLTGSRVHSVSATWTSSTVPSGWQTVTPTTQTQSYAMTALGDNAPTSVATTTVTVEQPISLSLTASSTGGGQATLSWTVTNPSNAVLSCVGSSSDGAWTGTVLPSGGSQTVSSADGTTFTLTCSDPVQLQTATATLTAASNSGGCNSGWNGPGTT